MKLEPPGMLLPVNSMFAELRFMICTYKVHIHNEGQTPLKVTWRFTPSQPVHISGRSVTASSVPKDHSDSNKYVG